MRKPVDLEEGFKLDYDATPFAEVGGEAVRLLDMKSHGHVAHVENLVVPRGLRESASVLS